METMLATGRKMNPSHEMPNTGRRLPEGISTTTVTSTPCTQGFQRDFCVLLRGNLSLKHSFGILMILLLLKDGQVNK